MNKLLFLDEITKTQSYYIFFVVDGRIEDPNAWRFAGVSMMTQH